MSKVVTIPEACSELKVSSTKVRSLFRRGVLKGFQDGRIVRITRDSVEALVSGRGEQPRPAA